MPKTQEKLNVIKEEVEALNNKLKELSPEELKSVTGGSSNQYSYVFKSGDFVYYTIDKTERLMIRENVETNDSSYKVKCEKMYNHPVHISSPDEFVKYVSCRELMTMYERNGGKFYR